MMRKLTYNLLVLLALCVSTSIYADSPTYKNELTKEIHETFSVSSGVELGVHNKYGHVTITTWDKNQIQVDVDIKVHSNNKEKGQKFLEGITVDFNASSSRVEAKTIYPTQENNSWWSSWFGNNKNIKFEVHYTIQAPERMSTSLINKYGNISLASINGDCDVVNKYGDITLGDISGDLELDLGYGKAKMGSVGDSEMQIKYSEIKIQSVKELRISTKYSHIKINDCEEMISQTKYDDYTIGTLGRFKNEGKYDEFNIGSVVLFSLDTKYTDVNIGELKEKATFNTKYGSVNIKETSNSLEAISIQSKYTGFEFHMNGNFHLDFHGSRTDLHLKEPYEKYRSDKDGSDLSIMAYRGSKNGGAKIMADMRYGGLSIH